MEQAVYAAEAALEERHWWFVCRRRLFARELARAGVAKDAAMLDVGTSTGTNLRMLRDAGYHDVTGLDMSDEAIRYCRDKGLGDVRKGDICAMPFPDARFDAVLATDIVEHVDDDAAALAEIRRVLKPGGLALLTVPAFEQLWGAQDDLSHHKRRYRLPRFCALVEETGLEVERRYHFNYLLFAPIWLARQIIRRSGATRRSENHINAPGLNELLTLLFEIDCRTAPLVRPPFGVSILVGARENTMPVHRNGASHERQTAHTDH
ncbi:MAG: methyltransferase domain-containing protein [Alphaproteobacteria bacterium]|nr:methyltransferase domain-containing protein [Alphaproteobacteria bacterium]